MSWGLGRREKKKKDCPPVQFCAQSVQSGLLENRMAQGLGSEAQRRLFEQIRQAVPLVDAATRRMIFPMARIHYTIIHIVTYFRTISVIIHQLFKNTPILFHNFKRCRYEVRKLL